VKHPVVVGLDVSRETQERLEAFIVQLLRWNSTINLISRRDEPDIWRRHVVDSLALAPLLPEPPGTAVDLGSGGGFPGLVLAIATGRHFHLVEADQRKAAFLREAARATATPVTIHATRIEHAATPPAQIITARALAPLTSLLGWAVPHLAAGGICLFPKGRTAHDELTAAATQWHMLVETFASATDASSTILRIRDIHRVGPAPEPDQ